MKGGAMIMQSYEFKAVNSLGYTLLSSGGFYNSYEEAMRVAYDWFRRINDKSDLHLEVVAR